MLYIDDALTLSSSLEGARDSCQRMKDVMGSKGLEVCIDKSVYLLSCKKKNIGKIRQEIANNPLLYNGSPLKEKLTDKWLGSIINPIGVRESTISTINDRKFRILNIINETISIIEDCRFNKVGAMKSVKEIWEIAIVPAILSNCEFCCFPGQKIDKNQKKCWY